MIPFVRINSRGLGHSRSDRRDGLELEKKNPTTDDDMTSIAQCLLLTFLFISDRKTKV